MSSTTQDAHVVQGTGFPDRWGVLEVVMHPEQSYAAFKEAFYAVSGSCFADASSLVQVAPTVTMEQVGPAD